MNKYKSLIIPAIFITVIGSGLFFVKQIKAGNCGGAVFCGCGDTVVANTTLTTDLNCTGHGLIAGAHNITIDGNGHTLTGDGFPGDYGVNNLSGWDNVVVKNFGDITNFGRGLYFRNADGSIIQNNTIIINSNLAYGITLDTSPSSTIAGNTVHSSENSKTSTRGIFLYSSPSSTLISNTVNSNDYGIYLASSPSSIINNTINSNAHGVYLVFSPSSSLISNTVNSNDYGIYFSSSSSSGLANNNISLNSYDIFYNDTSSINTYSSNQFNHNLVSKMFTFVETTRTKNLYDPINFDISMFYPDGSACFDCSYQITASPSETIASTRFGNNVTGSFTVTKLGTYSLIFTITDPNLNVTKRRILFFVGTTGLETARYYLRGVNATHGQPLGNGGDAKSLLLTAPISTEEWRCGGWIQNSPDETPNYPLANLSSIDIYSWYKQLMENGAYIGVERYVTYSTQVNISSSVPAAADYIWINKNFTDFNWGMDYLSSWYWLSLKLYGTDPYWQTIPSQPSYVDFTYMHTTTPAIKSISGTNINILSATAPAYSSSSPSIVVEGNGSTNIILANNKRPFLNAGNNINSNLETALTISNLTGTAQFDSVFMELVPFSDSIDVNINTWQNSGIFYRKWTELSANPNVSVNHIVGDLWPNSSYTLNINGTRFNTYVSDNSGVISFVYNGGYTNVKTFELIKSVIGGGKMLPATQI